MSKRKRRRRFKAEYKAEAVKHLVESGLPLRNVAGELDLSVGQLSQWRNEHLAAGSAEALALRRADEAELQRLRREIADRRRRSRSCGRLRLFSPGRS